MARLLYRVPQKRHRGARRKNGWQGSMRLGALFAVLVGINIYVFFFRGGTSIRDLLKTSALSKKAVPLTQGRAPRTKGSGTRADAADDSLVVEGSLAGHLGLSSALSAAGVGGSQAADLITALRAELDMRALRPENRFEARMDPRFRKIRKFTYRV